MALPGLCCFICCSPFPFALKLKQSFPNEKVTCYIARGAGHSDSSRAEGHKQAVKSFIDQYLDGPANPPEGGTP